MGPGSIARWRLANVGLLGPSYAGPGDVAARLVASQAQDLLPGRWSLAQRCAAVPTEGQVAAAHDRGDFVRLHTLRPTWHFVAAGDLSLVLAATSERVHQVNSHMYRRTGLDPARMAKVRALLEDALSAGPLSRNEVQQLLERAGAAGPGVPAAYVLIWAELEGWVCSGPSAGRQQTYALVADRVPDLPRWDPEEARAELALRFLSSRGPATLKDLATWASLTVTQARRAVEAVADRLERFEVEGRTYWTGAPPPDAPVGPVVSLVQAYDEVVMSYAESRDVLTGGKALWDVHDRVFMHHVLVDGRLVGRWRYERDPGGRPAEVTLQLDRPLDGEERTALEAEVERFAAFVGRPVALAVPDPGR